MNSIMILTFSGSGNTQFVVDALIRSLAEKGVEAGTMPMEKLLHNPLPQEFSDAHLIGIAFPVHAFNPPPLVEQLIRKLPSFDGKKCFIIKTAGSPWANGGVSSRLKRILASEHLSLQYETLVPMPSNFAVRYTDSFIKLNLLLALKQADQIAGELILGKKKTIAEDFVAKAVSYIALAERIGARFYGHYLKVDPSCTHCGLCFRECPTRNISFSEGKFLFGWKCTLCMRCSFCCPVQAYGHKHLGKLLFVKPPYDLKHILEDQSIAPADIRDNRISYMKDYRNFCLREGLLK